jgi:hypothetical protein
MAELLGYVDHRVALLDHERRAGVPQAMGAQRAGDLPSGGLDGDLQDAVDEVGHMCRDYSMIVDAVLA